MTTLYVTYNGPETAEFDRDYYVDTHLPLVRKAWEPHGLQSVAGFFPLGGGEGIVAVAILKFRDRAAADAALNADVTSEVMGDVPKFTDIKPVMSQDAPL